MTNKNTFFKVTTTSGELKFVQAMYLNQCYALQALVATSNT